MVIKHVSGWPSDREELRAEMAANCLLTKYYNSLPPISHVQGTCWTTSHTHTYCEPHWCVLVV